MSALLAGLLANPTILAIIAGVLGALGWGFHQRLSGAKAERNAQKAKEADNYARHIKDVEDAAYARDHVDPAGVHDDRYNRDRQG